MPPAAPSGASSAQPLPGDMPRLTAAAKRAANVADRPTCYICCEPEGRLRSQQLLRGCACRGTHAGYAHLSCLVAAAQYNAESWTVCSTCRQRFTGAVQLGLARARWQRVRLPLDRTSSGNEAQPSAAPLLSPSLCPSCSLFTLPPLTPTTAATPMVGARQERRGHGAPLCGR